MKPKTYRITSEEAADRLKHLIDDCDMDTLAQLFGEAFGYDTWTDQTSCSHLLCATTNNSCDELLNVKNGRSKMNIYLLQGSTGEYSDRTDWIVRAYYSKDQAQQAQMALTDIFAKLWKIAQDNKIHGYSLSYPEDIKIDLVRSRVIDYLIQLRAIDPIFQCDYTGTTWWVEEVELV